MAKRKMLIGFIAKAKRSAVDFWLHDDGSLVLNICEEGAKPEHPDHLSAASCELDSEQVGKLFAFLRDYRPTPTVAET